MPFDFADTLLQLGAGKRIAEICATAGISPTEFSTWWKKQAESRVPVQSGKLPAGVTTEVNIARDAWGIPHITAGNDVDLFFGFGYATAQDRLFQLDYLRRRALGRLSEVLGQEGYELDLLARTVGLHLSTEARWAELPADVKELVQAWTAGVNALIEQSRSALPIEFDLLGYQPEPWLPQDCVAIEVEFGWYLTGRFPVIAIPELAKRTLGDGPLYREFLLGEADDEAILANTRPGGLDSATPAPALIGETISDALDGHGSNNWVIAGCHTETGKPLVASDPHIAFAAVSCWHEVHLQGGSFNVTGMAYVGIPGVMFGRNVDVAWGCTNNICSLRDLYQERTDPTHPGCFEFNKQWEPARERTEVIDIRGREPVSKTIRSSRNGPIVDEILPPPARGFGPVSLRWLGNEQGGWLTALLAMDRARTADEFREATRAWHVPTFCVVFADETGRIGYQCTGRIPIRNLPERGFRPGWDPAHQWDGLIPFEGMPSVMEPAEGWVITANNRVAHKFPYPLSGTWSSGHRGLRIRQMLESLTAEKEDGQQGYVSRYDCIRMQQDAMNLRAVECLPRLLKILGNLVDATLRAGVCEEIQKLAGVRLALNHLAAWDCRSEPDRVGAMLFNVFFAKWSQVIAESRFQGEAAALIAGAAGGLANRLLIEDRVGWFSHSNRDSAVLLAMQRTLQQLTEQFGPNMLDWAWGRLHTLQQKHILTARGDLSQLLDRGQVPVRGDSTTVCNTSSDPQYGAFSGAGYRLLADLSDTQHSLWAIDAGAESGHPGSPHYDDQLLEWLTGGYHQLALSADAKAKTTLTLVPN